MKEIRLNKLTLDNFKGQRHLELNFDGANVSILGDNAAGKTTVYDALTWLLFGKDSRGQSNFEIKPLNLDGTVQDHANISLVEAVFSVDGEEVQLRKTYYEKWSTKRGSASETYDGNTSDYYIDAVPCKKYEFDKKVSELVDEEHFRLLTNVSHFASGLDWKKRREILFDICGVMSDAEVMALHPQFAALAEACGKLSIDAFKKKLQQERRGYSGLREDVPVRIDECKRTVKDLSGIDFSVIQSEAEERISKREQLASEFLRLEHNELLSSKRNELSALQNQLDKLENDNWAHRQNQATSVVDQRPALERDLRFLEDSFRQGSARRASLLEQIAEHEDRIGSCRDKWKETNAKPFPGQNCVTCGQALTGALLERAAKSFDDTKAERLSALVSESDRYKSLRSKSQEQLEREIENLVYLENQVAETKGKLTACAPVEQPEITDLGGYAANKEQLSAQMIPLRAEIEKLSVESASIRQEIRAKLATLGDEIAAINSTLAKEAILKSAQERMVQLGEEAKAAAEKIEAIDKLLFLAEDFTRCKVQFIEGQVNGEFRLSKFRLFREQVNGGLDDCCDVMLDGVPYESLNNGARINVGMDIIETLSKHYGVTVPLFVDNAESVTSLYQIGTQVIRLVVSEGDKELRCVG